MANRQKQHIILLESVLPSAAHQLNKCLNMKKVMWVKPPLTIMLEKSLKNTLKSQV